jgi:hypothetical protein
MKNTNNSQNSTNETLEDRLVDLPSEKNYESDKYAVLISGRTEGRHAENLETAYNALIGQGFLLENIFILDNERGPAARFEYPVDAPATKENIKIVMENIQQTSDDKDLLFLYVTGHGGREKVRGEYVSTILLSDGEEMDEIEMDNLLEGIEELRVGILVFDQCYGGGFVERSGDGRYVAVSASKPNEVSYSNTFPLAFFNAWEDSESDINKDGRISIQETFDYATENDSYANDGDQMPLIRSEDMNSEEIFIDNIYKDIILEDISEENIISATDNKEGEIGYFFHHKI